MPSFPDRNKIDAFEFSVIVEKTIQQEEFEPLKITVGARGCCDFEMFDEVVDKVHSECHRNLKKLFKKHGIKNRYVKRI